MVYSSFAVFVGLKPAILVNRKSSWPKLSLEQVRDLPHLYLSKQARFSIISTVSQSNGRFVTILPLKPSTKRLRICSLLMQESDAGIAAIPLTDAMLGWPLALAFLLLMAYTTYATLNILVRHVPFWCSTSPATWIKIWKAIAYNCINPLYPNYCSISSAKCDLPYLCAWGSAMLCRWRWHLFQYLTD